MNASRFAVGLVGVALAGLWYFAGGAQPLPVSQAAETSRVTKPLTHENLTVYFVYGTDSVPDAKVMTLNEALERELAIVHETSDVNTLAVENKSPDYELFIQSGDIVKGGKQDRMAANDMLLPPKSGVVPLPAHCVEQGRWTGRGGEDSKKFASSVKCRVGNEMKIANYNGQQSAVWQNVSMNQTKLNDNLKTTVNAAASPTSFQLTLEAPAVKASVAEYETALKAAGTDRDDIIGVVFVVNGKVTGAEVYGSNALFRKAWPKLLNSAAVEAVAERTDKPTASPPSAREIEYFLARAAEPEPASNTPKTRYEEYELFIENLPNGVPNNLDQQRITEAADQLRMASRRGRQGRAVPNANEEVFQTEGRAPGEFFQTEGRQPEPVRPVLTLAGSPADAVLLPIPAPNPPAGGVQVEYTGPIAQQAGGAAAFGNRAPAQPPALRTITAIPIQGLDNVIVREPPPANPAGNRLNSNRNENSSTLMVESRDPARQNAVIHRSYIQKGPNAGREAPVDTAVIRR